MRVGAGRVNLDDSVTESIKQTHSGDGSAKHESTKLVVMEGER
jgi:hypothetical protein